MKVLPVALLLSYGFAAALHGSESLERARQLEQSGDAAQAREVLARSAHQTPANAAALGEYAEFLDRYADPARVDAYAKLLAVLDKPDDGPRRAAVAQRLAELRLLEGDRAGAERYLEIARQSGGTASAPAWPPANPAASQPLILIPGPLAPFSRMAALSGDAQPADLLPALARNVVTNGYQASHGNEALEPTEYLKLVHRYLSQARELDKLAGPAHVIAIETCDSPQAADLLKILGFRIRGGCGSELVLETVNATRAFLTTDSGFPIPELEQALRTNRPFHYDYQPAHAPLLFGRDYWLATQEKDTGEFLDAFLSDPALCRLYLGMSKLDPSTADELRKNIPMPRLKAFAAVLDFFGAMFEIHDGKALVPGAPRTNAAWTELAGAPPDQGAAFFEKLIARDDGWLASYFDALARIDGPLRDYLTEPARMKRYYQALRGKVTSPGPARPVFRSNAEMMLLTTRLWLDPDGRPHLPGGLQLWKNLFAGRLQGKPDLRLMRAAAAWKDPDDVVEALFGLARKAVDNEPLTLFLALSDLDRHRPSPLAVDTVDRLARDFHQFGQQYKLFNDAAVLSDRSIIQFLDAAGEINRLKEPLLRADAAGILQSLAGMWQIFSRQGSLPAATADETFAGIVKPFAEVRSGRELFDAGQSGVNLLLKATGAPAGAPPQEQLLDLLAGAANPGDAESHTDVVKDMMRIMESQRIVSLDDLFELAGHLDNMAHGGAANTAPMHKLEARISEIPLPRATLSTVEKNSLAFGFWTEKHIDAERKLNLRAAIDKGSGEKLRDVRGLLTPFLRDTLVAYNYAHYAPPGAQVLYTNPLFVRGHDFLGLEGYNHTWQGTEVFGTGWPSNGGGRLVGSLAGLPYALAQAEQNFLVPDKTQALIWGDLAPQMMVGAIIPRWWNVTPSQLHWVALHQRYGKSLLAKAALDPALRSVVLEILSTQAPPGRVYQVGALLESGSVQAALDKVTPAELFVLAKRMSARRDSPTSPLLAEIRRLAAASPNLMSDAAISSAFGTPKPALANSYVPGLLHLRTFPTLMGYSSRILAESWESNSLYWAELADETHTTPGQLNLRIPEWTQRLVEHIFASHLEDWPAVLRSLRAVGDDVRTKSRQPIAEQKAALQ